MFVCESCGKEYDYYVNILDGIKKIDSIKIGKNKARYCCKDCLRTIQFFVKDRNVFSILDIE